MQTVFTILILNGTIPDKFPCISAEWMFACDRISKYISVWRLSEFSKLFSRPLRAAKQRNCR